MTAEEEGGGAGCAGHQPSLTHLFICLPGNLPVCLFSHLLCIYPSIYLSVCLFISHLSLYTSELPMVLTLSSTFKQESEHTCASAGPLLPPAVGTAPPVPWNLHLPLQVETLGFREPYNL